MGLFNFGSKKETKVNKLELLATEANAFSKKLNDEKNLPAINTQITLKSGEEAFTQTESTLYETRGVSYNQGGSTGGAVRVMKGVWLGGSSRTGKSETKQELREIDSGLLVLTNKRFVFDGKYENRIIPLDKIISVEPRVDSIEVSTESKAKSMMFTVPNAFIWVFTFQILIQAPDPHKLADVHMTARVS